MAYASSRRSDFLDRPMDKFRVAAPTSRLGNSRFALGGFAVITIIFGCQWVWNTRGREVLDFASDSLTRRRFLFRFSRVEHFQMSKITNPRFVGSRRRAKGSTPCGLGFSYENRSFRIGDHLSWSESK